jgi:hypothetical protein
MRDPHTKESRGFGFVKMVTSEQADAAKDGLQNEEIEGRTLSIEKARRSRPRTPTPGKYFGPPKRGQSSITPASICYTNYDQQMADVLALTTVAGEVATVAVMVAVITTAAVAMVVVMILTVIVVEAGVTIALAMMTVVTVATVRTVAMIAAIATIEVVMAAVPGAGMIVAMTVDTTVVIAATTAMVALTATVGVATTAIDTAPAVVMTDVDLATNEIDMNVLIEMPHELLASRLPLDTENLAPELTRANLMLVPPK